VAVTTGTSLLELLLALLSSLSVPIARVNVVGDDLVSELLHGGQHVSASGEIRRSHVGRLLADDIDHGLSEELHFLLQLVGAKTAEVRRVSPGVTGDLVARVVNLLDGGRAVVNAAVEFTSSEEGGFSASVVEDIDELVGVLSSVEVKRVDFYCC
jgi:hypothetical protein